MVFVLGLYVIVFIVVFVLISGIFGVEWGSLLFFLGCIEGMKYVVVEVSCGIVLVN